MVRTVPMMRIGLALLSCTDGIELRGFAAPLRARCAHHARAPRRLGAKRRKTRKVFFPSCNETAGVSLQCAHAVTKLSRQGEAREPYRRHEMIRDDEAHAALTRAVGDWQ